MPVVRSRLWILGVCAALVAGCGGGGSTIGGGGGTGGGGGGNNPAIVTITFKGSTPVVVAAKIGTGAYAAQTLSGSTLSLSIPSGTSNYAVAFLCLAQGTTQSSLQNESVWEASITDGTSVSFLCPSVPSQTGALTGNLDASAIPGVVQFVIASQNGSSLYEDGLGGGSTASFDLPAVSGNDRILVLAFANQFAYQGDGPVAAKNFDNQTVPGALNGGNTVVFGTSDETTPEAITYNNVPSGFSTPNTYAALGMGGATGEVLLASNATTQYLALPASATEKGDVYFLDAGAYATGGNAPGANSAVLAGTTTSGGPVSFTLPAPWSYAGPTAAALPSFTMGYTGFSGANISQNAFIQWNSASGTGSSATVVISVEATTNYQNGSTTLAIPDLSGVAEFLAPPASGTQVEWLAWSEQQSYGLTSPAPLNGTLSEVTNSGLYTVP